MCFCLNLGVLWNGRKIKVVWSNLTSSVEVHMLQARSSISYLAANKDL